MFHKKTKFLVFALMLVIATILGACTKTASVTTASESKTVQTDSSTSTEQQTNALEPISYGGQLYPEEFLLKGKDFFSPYGLTVEHTLFSSGGENNTALVSGAVDINIGSDSKSVALFGAMGEEVVIIAASQRGDRYSTMVNKDSGIKTWYEMKGKKVGVALTTGAEQVIRRYFEKVGDLKWEDFEWVDLKVQDMAAALADGSIESFTAWEPTPAIAEASSGAVVMMSYGDIALTPVFIHTTQKFAATHRNELVAFLRGHLDKVTMIKGNIDEAAKITAEAASAQGTEVSPDIFKTIFQRVDFSLDVNDQVKAALTDTANFLLETKQIDKIPEFYFDNSFLEEAKKLNQ